MELSLVGCRLELVTPTPSHMIPHFPPQLILGTSTPLPVIASLVPIMAGVALASAAELSFNW